MWALREEAHKTVDLREANHFLVGNVSHFRKAIDRHEVVLTSAGEVNLVDADHLFDVHFVIDNRNLWEFGVIESRKDFIDVHFRDSMWRFFEAVITEVKTQCVHDGLERLANTVVFLISREVVYDHGRFKTALKQRPAHSDRLVREGTRQRRSLCFSLNLMHRPLSLN